MNGICVGGAVGPGVQRVEGSGTTATASGQVSLFRVDRSVVREDHSSPGGVAALFEQFSPSSCAPAGWTGLGYGFGMRPPFRVGTGHDVHRLVQGGALVLGGVDIPSPVGFDTHSDGDVLSHALVDALAGAIADGDLGTHFPEDDPDAEDARSLDFVPHLAGLVRAAGYEVANVDSFVVVGAPALRPHLDEMRRNLAEALGIDLTQVSVKARSNDGIGEAGESRACEAWATVLIYLTSG